MAKKTFQDIPLVGVSENLTDYQHVVTKTGVDKRVPYARIKADILAAVPAAPAETTLVITSPNGTITKNQTGATGHAVSMDVNTSALISTDTTNILTQDGSGRLIVNSAILAESGLQIVAKKARLGGKLKQNTTIDGDNVYGFNVLHTPSVNLSGSDGSYNSFVRLDDNGILISGQGLGVVNGSIQIDGTHVLVGVNNGVSSIKLDQLGVYLENLAAKTGETQVLFIDSTTGKLSKGTLTTSGTIVLSEQVNNIAEWKDGKLLVALNNSSTIMLQEQVLGDGTIARAPRVIIDALISQQAGNALVKVGDSLYVPQAQTVSETANNLVNTDTITFTTGAANQPLNRTIAPNVVIPALISTSQHNDIELDGGQLIVGKVETESSETILLDFRKDVPTRKTYIKGQVQTASLVSSVAGNQIQLLDLVLADGRVIQQMFVPNNSNGGSFAPSADLGNIMVLGGDNLPYVGNLEKQFAIAPSVTSSFSIRGRADSLYQITNSDFSANYDSASSTLQFSNDSASISFLKKPRFRSIEITIWNMGGVLDANGNLKIMLPREFHLKSNESELITGDEFKASFPRPRVQNVSSPAVSELNPFVWDSGANVPIESWIETSDPKQPMYYKFIGLNIYNRVQIYLDFN